MTLQPKHGTHTPVHAHAFIPIGVDPVAPLSKAGGDAALARRDLSASLIVHLLRENQIDIDRMASPQLIEQLLHSASRPIDAVICTALDSDASCQVNTAVAAAYGSDVRLGIQLLAAAVRASRSIVAADASGRWSALAGRRTGDQPRLFTLDYTYPQLHPVLLLQKVLKRRLAPSRLPVEAGALVVDAAAAWTIARLIAGDVSVAVPIGICDHRTGRTTFAAVAPELTLRQVLASLNIPAPGEGQTAVEGELLLRRRSELAESAGASSSTLHLCPCSPDVASEPCTRCNWCADVCPTGVLPMLALEAAQFNQIALADRAKVAACIECGLCDYVCPSRLPLVEATRAAKHLAGASPARGLHDRTDASC